MPTPLHLLILFTAAFGEVLRGAGVEPVRLPPRSPNLNAYAERFVRSIKEECLSNIIPLGEGHLRWVISEYVEHYTDGVIGDQPRFRTTQRAD